MTQKHNATRSQNQKIRKDSTGLSSKGAVLQKPENSNRKYQNKYKRCVNDNSRNTYPELTVKDFSSYYLSGSRGCFVPNYSVTSHTAPCYAEQNDYPTCSHQSNVQLENCLQPAAASHKCRPGYTEQHHARERKLSGGKTHKRESSDPSKDNLKFCKKSSNSTFRNMTVPQFKSAYTGRCYYEAYQVSNTDLSQKKGVKFYNDGRDEVSHTTSKNTNLHCRLISRSKVHKPMHLVEEASGCCSEKIKHRKPIPSCSIRSFDDANTSNLCVFESSRAGRVKNYRRILYNEGIDDDLVGRQPAAQRRPPSPPAADKRSSNGWMRDEAIPCSYVNKSKYHYHCKEEVDKKCYKHDGNDDVDTAEHSGDLPAQEIPVILYRAPSIKLPRKVLATIRAIDGRTIL